MELVGNIVLVCIAALFLIGGYAWSRCVLRRYKRGERILATQAAKKELLYSAVCTTLGMTAVWGLVT